MFYPKIQFSFDGGEVGGCPSDHVHATIFDMGSIAVARDLSTIPQPDDVCGFGLESVIPESIIQMTQAEIDAWNADTGLTIITI